MTASVKCGSLAVFENRDSKAGKTITLDVIVLEAAMMPKAPDPNVILAGGPGISATSLARQFGASGTGFRDLVFIDQRGTAGDHRLSCPLGDATKSVRLLDSLFPDSIAQRCLARSARIADLTRYATSISADDLDEILTWLGYGAVNVTGSSYGTALALEFARRHGDRVRTMRLSAPIPPTANLSLDEARNAQGALDNLFDACAATAHCQSAFPDLKREFQSVVQRLAAGPIDVRVPLDGRPTEFRLGRTGFAVAVQHALYGALARWLPTLIHDAYTSKDLSWFALYFSNGRAEWESLPMGMYFSVSCSEDAGRVSAEALANATKATFMGDAVYRQRMAACDGWSRASVPADFHAELRSPIPTIVETGRFDPITPPRYVDLVKAGLPNAVTLIWPFGGHGGRAAPADFQCGGSLDRYLLQRASVVGLDISCVAAGDTPTFPVGGRPPAALMRF